jgi:hypothetical protein
MTTYCKVYLCRFNNTHTTKNHLCGSCKTYGHGNIECKNEKSINYLKKYLNDTMSYDNRCEFAGCNNRLYHTTEGHHCDNCFERLHSIETCPLLVKNDIVNNVNNIVICPLCKTENTIASNQSKIYGVDDLCAICMDNKIDVFLPNCGHLCLCTECKDKLDKNINKKNFGVTPDNYDIDTLKKIFKNYPSYTMINQARGYNCIIRRLNDDSDIEYLIFDNDMDTSSNFIKGYAFVRYNLT